MFGKKEGARVSGDTGVNNGRRIALGVFRDVALAGVLGMYVFPKIFEIFFAGNDAGYKEFKKAMREEYDISEFEGDDFANVENMPLCNDRDFLSKGGVCKDKDGKLFDVFKIKTMKPVDGLDTTITTSNDMRITKSGKFFRDTKIDELPQLFNVLFGSMSFVGPRPDVKGYADELKGDDRIILSIRPAITGPASIKYKNEEEILAKVDNPKEYNDTVIWRDKVKINKEYIKNWSLKKDIEYILKTFRG